MYQHFASVNRREKRRNSVNEQSDQFGLVIIQIVDSNHERGIIDRLYHRLQIVQPTELPPLFEELSIPTQRLRDRRFGITDLTKDWHIVKGLKFPLIIVFILNGYDMSEPLIVTSESVLVYPFAVIRTQPVEIDPNGTRPINNSTLGPVCID